MTKWKSVLFHGNPDRFSKKETRYFHELIVRNPKAKKLESLSVQSRIRHESEDDPDYVEYGFAEGNFTGWTEEEVQEYVDRFRYEVRSPYDCTGKPFTTYIHGHVNPDGRLSICHYVGSDI